jgi:hypothetical protein
MTDKIVYTVTENGVDGRAPTTVMFASFDEQERDKWYESKANNKAWYSKSKQIVEIENELKQALAKLDGIHRLMLNIKQRD